uniref:Galectin 3 binding protein, tandem duplicate 1 n=1 Tax=Scleropages formosus TaxID=113540 RepID=A0A8C9T116_SCLFO
MTWTHRLLLRLTVVMESPLYTPTNYILHVIDAFRLWACLSDTGMDSEAGQPVDEVQGLSEDMGWLFDSGRGCDFTVVVQSLDGNDSDDSVCVHRLVLSLDPQSVFFDMTQESKSFTMDVRQSCRPYVNAFLRYIYTRQINVTISSIQCIYQMASDYGFKSLQAECGRLFSWLLPDDSTFVTTVSLYNYAVAAGDPVLQETCLRYLAWNCAALVGSEAWLTMSEEAVEVFLSCSDLVVPDESFLLRALESWLRSRDNRTEAGIVPGLLGLIRFPMISAERLYDIPYSSDLYHSYAEVYNAEMVQGYPFQALTFDKLRRHLPSMDVEHSPRIYTEQPWSFTVSAAEVSAFLQQPYYGWSNGLSGSLSTPVLNSAIYQDKTTTWYANVFLNKQQCLNQGYTCDSTPAVSLYQTGYNQYQNDIQYDNCIVLLCNGSYVFHVQKFNSNRMVLIPSGSNTGQEYPCAGERYSYLFVVRPQYIL